MSRIFLFAAVLAWSQVERMPGPEAKTAGTVERLSGEHQPLVRDFQASRGRARLVAILSPT